MQPAQLRFFDSAKTAFFAVGGLCPSVTFFESDASDEWKTSGAIARLAGHFRRFDRRSYRGMDGERGIRLQAIASVCARRDLQESSKECRGDAQKSFSQIVGLKTVEPTFFCVLATADTVANYTS